MAYFQGKVAFRQLIFGGYLVAITRILGYMKKLNNTVKEVVVRLGNQ